MGLFSALKDKIFGSSEAKAATVDATAAPAAAPVAAPAAAPARAPIGLEKLDEVLAHIAAKKGVTLNWKTSIVDLMKLVDMDSSLANRKELAQELGYGGALDGSAEMNIWLIGKVRERLAGES